MYSLLAVYDRGKRRLLVRAFTRLLQAGTIMLALSAYAGTDEQDMAVGMKTLPLLMKKIEGTATIAIIYDPMNPASVQEANGIKAIVDARLVAPVNLNLIATLVQANKLDTLAASRIAVLTNGLGAYYGAISSAASSGGVLTMSTDLDCVRINACVLGIVSKPHVEIYFSKIAADAAKIEFDQIFKMLIKQM